MTLNRMFFVLNTSISAANTGLKFAKGFSSVYMQKPQRSAGAGFKHDSLLRFINFSPNILFSRDRIQVAVVIIS